MTEQEWRVCTDWLIVRRISSERKLRLFSCACCRGIWDLLTDERSRKVVEVAERFADGDATNEELHTADDAAYWAYHDAPTAAKAPAIIALTTTRTEIWRVCDASEYACLAHAGRDQSLILRCIFGRLPFHSVTLAPAWLSWHGGLLVSMARQMYDSRDFSDLPILADALEEAGCTNADILGHCRSGGEHVRGCWVIDLLLGKQ